MEGRSLRGSYFGTADERQDEFLVASTAEDVFCYDDLISGLENFQAVSGTGDQLSAYSDGYVAASEVGDPALEALRHGFGGWTRYPTDDSTLGYSVTSNDSAPLSSPLFTTDGYIRSLSQPDSQNDITDEFYQRSRSCSEHFDVFSDMSACDLSTFAQRGRETYSEALGQWNKVEPSEPKIYDPFGTAGLLQQHQHQQAPVLSPPPQPVSCTTPSSDHPRPVPEQSKQPFSTVIPDPVKVSKKSKPSYSEVAKNNPELRSAPKQKMHHVDVKHRCKKNDSSNGKPHHVHHNVSHVPDCFHSRRASELEPKTIKPNSRYGLDTFEEPVFSQRSVGDQLSCNTNESPHHFKDGTNSSSSSCCDIQEPGSVDHLKESAKAEQTTVNSFGDAFHREMHDEVNCDTQKHNSRPEKHVHINNGEVKENPIDSRLPGISVEDSCRPKNKPVDEWAKKHDRSKGVRSSSSKQQDAEHVFFDPKRIFGTKSQPSRSHSASASTKGYIPNNQHSQTLHRPKQQDPDSILNNDKPNTKSNSNINKSCYINNNLREPLRTSTKKQVNADAQRESVNASEHARVDSHSVPGHDTSCSDSTHRQKAKESVTRNKPPVSTRVKSTKSKWDWQNLLGELAVLVYHWMAWVAEELGKVLWNVTKLIISIGLALLITLGQSSFVTISDIWITFSAKLFSFRSTPKKDHTSKKTLSHKGLKENIILPATGDEAMYRLLANKGKDPYSILGVRSDASDEVIKKYYRRQAVLVHPDKNQMPGAEEAFKILGHAFDLIGEPEKRRQFDTQTLESQEEEEAFYQFADLLNKLHEKMQEAANLMRCENCGGKHRRIPTERLLDSARFCQKCGYNHSVHEGDVWAESHMLGFRWNYYACMEGKVYDITEWASCQADRFQHIQANSHHIAYRIATQSNTSASRHRRTRSNEDELEDFLNQLFHQSSEPNKAGPASDGANFGQFGTSRPTSGTSNKPTNTAWSKKGRRRKKRH